MTHHSKASGVKLYASRKFKEARPEKQTTIVFNRQKIGKEFKKNGQKITNMLEKASEEEKSAMKEKFESEGKL